MARLLDEMLVKALESHLGATPPVDTWGGVLGDIQANDPNLYVELLLLDRLLNGMLFHDPNTTISWEIATRAAAGDSTAIALCTALDALSPDHCAKTLAAHAAPKT